MVRLSTRFSLRAAGLLLASLLGALAGAAMVQPRAGACSCVEPMWRLTLRTGSADGGAPPDTQDWPSLARLEAYSGRAILWSEYSAGDTVDFLLAGGP